MRKFKKLRSSKNFWLLLFGVIILVAGILIIWVSSLKIPDFNSFEDVVTASSTKIYDRTGEVLLYDIHQDVRRTTIALSDMGINIQNATIAVEDAEFYQHPGIRVTSIVRATLFNVLHIGKTQGGSTITQQLIKNTLLTSKKTLGRKIKEWVLALKIEKSLPKEKILELYLNATPYGGTIYGVEEAAKNFFGKSANNLTLSESAYIAAIPQSPTTLSPYGKHLDRLEERKNFVLFRMHELGYITQGEYETAKNEVVVFQPRSASGIKAPHFVFFIKDYLEEKYGIEVVEKGGLKVITTLDWKLEEKAEQFVKEGALQNAKDWNGKNAALVAIDPKTGQILTMVGSRDYFDKEIEGNFNVATASRQPGSSFKPFIYARAFEKGFTKDTVLFDLPTEFQTTCNAYGVASPGYSQSDCYKPDNYDGKFRGPLKLRDALAQSINIPAVKLLYLVGVGDAIKQARDMGITTLEDPARYGLTLVIGGGEVTLLDITSAYGVFANEGTRNSYTGILRVEDPEGKVLEEFKENPVDTIPRNIALTISDILSDNNARIPTFGANSPLNIPGRDVAAKTGTTNNNKDAWIIGYSPSIAVGVWAGNNDNVPMKKGGSAVAGPIWNKFMHEALKDLPQETFEEPSNYYDPETVKPVLRGYWQGNEHFFIDKISGKLASEFTPTETKEEKVITNVHSILYWVKRDDITGPPPSNPEDNPQFRHWEVPIQNWWAQNQHLYPKVTWNDAPKTIDDVHDQSTIPEAKILSPEQEISYSKESHIPVSISVSSKLPIQKIDVFINGAYVGTSTYPINFSFTPSELENLSNKNTIKVIVYDTAYNRSETESIFLVDN